MSHNRGRKICGNNDKIMICSMTMKKRLTELCRCRSVGQCHLPTPTLKVSLLLVVGTVVVDKTSLVPYDDSMQLSECFPFLVQNLFEVSSLSSAILSLDGVF